MAFIGFFDPVVEVLLDLVLNLLFEYEGRGCIILLKDFFLPSIVRFLSYREFNAKITCRHSGYIPFDLLDLATLELGTNRDSEDEADEDTSSSGKGNLIIFLLHVGC